MSKIQSITQTKKPRSIAPLLLWPPVALVIWFGILALLSGLKLIVLVPAQDTDQMSAAAAAEYNRQLATDAIFSPIMTALIMAIIIGGIVSYILAIVRLVNHRKS